jgi:hypothetical protein
VIGLFFIPFSDGVLPLSGSLNHPRLLNIDPVLLLLMAMIAVDDVSGVDGDGNPADSKRWRWAELRGWKNDMDELHKFGSSTWRTVSTSQRSYLMVGHWSNSQMPVDVDGVLLMVVMKNGSDRGGRRQDVGSTMGE